MAGIPKNPNGSIDFNQCAVGIITAAKNGDMASYEHAVLQLAHDLELIQTNERQRCADLATAVFLNRGTCKFGTDHGKGWNQACWDIHHRVTTGGRCLTQSPGPAMVKALQSVKADGEAYRTFYSVTITENTLTAVCEALEQFKTPKDL